MEIFVVDAFTAQKFSGNQAGVALLGAEEAFPGDADLQALAAELKHSETAFVKAEGDSAFRVRYFTPDGEVDLCGHATIAAFTLLREEGIAPPGVYTAHTPAGALEIEVGAEAVWMDMAAPELISEFSNVECAALYRAYGLAPDAMPPELRPMAVSTGLRDILLPVRSRTTLDAAEQNEAEVTRLSRHYQVVGIHMFCLDDEPDVTARCRNFAPLYGIREEAATGTSNGALTYYLYRAGLVRPGEENRFVQGERMGKPSEILTRLTDGESGARVRVGGRAVPVLRCTLL